MYRRSRRLNYLNPTSLPLPDLSLLERRNLLLPRPEPVLPSVFAAGNLLFLFKLVSIFISSPRLTHDTVLSLTAVHLRELRMLSLINGSEINDASVEAICKSYTNLELIDLSGSSITNYGIARICLLSDTLTVLHVASCPKITLSGISYACLSLYRLEVIDCALSTNDLLEESGFHIVHDDLKKLSLLECSNLVHLNLSCANLKDLNLNLCIDLETCDLSKCPKLERVFRKFLPPLLCWNLQLTLPGEYRARLIKLAKWMVEHSVVSLRLFHERCEEEFLSDSEMIKIKAADLKSKEDKNREIKNENLQRKMGHKKKLKQLMQS